MGEEELIFLLTCKYLIMSQNNKLSDELKLTTNKFGTNWEEWKFQIN